MVEEKVCIALVSEEIANLEWLEKAKTDWEL